MRLKGPFTIFIVGEVCLLMSIYIMILVLQYSVICMALLMMAIYFC